MKRNIFFGICGLILLFSSVNVYGQVVTVNEAKNLPHDSWVALTGNIINSLAGGKNYTFRDSSGEIVVEIDRNIWRGLSVGVSDTVEIFGELRVNRGQVSIRARAINGTNRINLGPGQAVMVSQPITVSEAKSLPHDSWVIINGNIINALPGGSNFIFHDSSGDVTIEIERKVWRGLSAAVSDKVEISGEVRINRGQVTIRVRAIKGINTA